MNEFFRQAFDLSGQVALVTGGGSGLGFARLSAWPVPGAKVVITGRKRGCFKKRRARNWEKGSAFTYLM